MNLYAIHFWPLLLLPALGIFYLLSRRSLTEGARGRTLVAFALRGSVLLLLLLALMDVHMRRVADQLTVIFLLDKSQSVPGSLRERAVQEMRISLRDMKEEDRAGMVVFGATASIETAAETKPDFTRIASGWSFSRTGTRIWGTPCWRRGTRTPGEPWWTWCP
jgi:hypothetical protein